MQTATTPSWALAASTIDDFYKSHGWYTEPGYGDTEAESATMFDDVVARTGLFRIHREVTGTLRTLRPGQEGTGKVRIDRVLEPTDAARRAGWQLDMIGVECKRSNLKVGRPISQMLDYIRATWRVQIDDHPNPFSDTGHVNLHLSHVFLWPYKAPGGPLGSILTQQRLGGVTAGREGVHFGAAHRCYAHVNYDGTFTHPHGIVGTKVGSR